MTKKLFIVSGQAYEAPRSECVMVGVASPLLEASFKATTAGEEYVMLGGDWGTESETTEAVSVSLSSGTWTNP